MTERINVNTTANITPRKSTQPGAAEDLGPASGSIEDYATQPEPAERPFVTCRKNKKLVGMYCTADEIMNHPEYLDELQERVGANVVIMSSGVNYPPDIRELAPFAPEQNQWIGMDYAEDDNTIHKCAEILHSRGMDIWLYGSGHSDRGNNDSYLLVDFNGEYLRNYPLLKYSLESQSTSTLCFQKPEISQWQVNAYAWICKNYDIDALYCSHHRYNLPFHYRKLLGCACTDCQEAAYRLGYNFDRMRQAMLGFQENLGGLTKEQLKLVADVGITLTDFLHLQPDGNEAINWLKFRATNVTDALSRINRAIKAATGGRCRFIVDTVNPTLSYLVGHDYSTFVGEASDALYCMAWVEDQSICFAATWAQALVEMVDGLDESTALKAVYSLIGWDDLNLPHNRIADLHIAPTRQGHDIPRFYRRFKSYLNSFMTGIFSAESTFHRSLAVNRRSLSQKKCQGIFTS